MSTVGKQVDGIYSLFPVTNKRIPLPYDLLLKITCGVFYFNCLFRCSISLYDKMKFLPNIRVVLESL